ncbi:hypothetical protein CFBP6625_14195 [Agrobacterium tumefaciens]|uniref:hypothetical protein n=1 Tax=Rhizobium sp. TaxID=391 RepID=UPI0010BE3590|nr:hypothetical protein CFBP6625_14195 [Agrobacterium tumefaciens]
MAFGSEKSVWAAAVFAVCCIFALPALAEVCDKGGEWDPATPVTLSSQIGIGLRNSILATLLIALSIFKHWAWLFQSVMLVLLVLLFFIGAMFFEDQNDPYIKSMIKEGCLHPASRIIHLIAFGMPLVIGFIAALRSVIKSQE